jgi:hypothetical protein
MITLIPRRLSSVSSAIVFSLLSMSAFSVSSMRSRLVGKWR